MGNFFFFAFFRRVKASEIGHRGRYTRVGARRILRFSLALRLPLPVIRLKNAKNRRFFFCRLTLIQRLPVIPVLLLILIGSFFNYILGHQCG